MVSKEKIVMVVNGLPDERFVEIVNLYAESEQRTWRIYKNTKDEFNEIFRGASAWDVAGEILNVGKEYNRSDEWLMLSNDYGLSSNNDPRKLLPYLNNVLDYMAEYYLKGCLAAPLVKALDEVLKD